MAANVRWAVTGDEIWVSGPYNEDFVDGIKRQIPHTDRRWIPARKVWAVKTVHKARIHTLVLAHYDVNLDEPEDRSAEHKAKYESAELERMRQALVTAERERDDALIKARNSQENIRRALRLQNEVRELQAKNAQLARELTSARLNQQFGSMFGRRNAGDGLSVRELFESANGKSIYKRLMMAVHPDNGGDAEMAKKITALWDEVGR